MTGIAKEKGGPTTSHPCDLNELARLAAAGEEAAQTDLFAALYPMLHKHLGFVLGFGPLVEDAVQESMVEVYRALPKFRGDSSPRTWALAIATRTAWRVQKRERKRARIMTSW